MTRAWLAPSQQAEYHRLCGAIVALGRTAVARLSQRDGDPLAFYDRGTGASEFTAAAGELRQAWLAAEAVVPGGGPLGRLSTMLRISDSFVEPTLLALAAAPGLARAVARSYATVERGPLTAGFLLELATTVEANRFGLASLLHPDSALRRSGLVTVGGDPHAAIAATTPIELAPVVLAVLRCEPVPLPAAVDELAAVPTATSAAAMLEALGLAPLRPGELATIADPGPGALALAQLFAAADGAALWRTELAAAEPDWLAWSRDAGLANAIGAVVADADGSWTARLRAILERTLRSAIVIGPRAGAIALAAVRARARSGIAQALATPGLAALLDAISAA